MYENKGPNASFLETLASKFDPDDATAVITNKDAYQLYKEHHFGTQHQKRMYPWTLKWHAGTEGNVRTYLGYYAHVKLMKRVSRGHYQWSLDAYRDSLIQDDQIQWSFTKPFVEEYIQEAEHQEGLGYWLNFKNAQELHDDMVLYRDNGPKP